MLRSEACIYNSETLNKGVYFPTKIFNCINRGYSMFIWLWIWNLFHKWDRVFIFSHLGKYKKNSVLKVKIVNSIFNVQNIEFFVYYNFFDFEHVSFNLTHMSSCDVTIACYSYSVTIINLIFKVWKYQHVKIFFYPIGLLSWKCTVIRVFSIWLSL